MGAGIASSLRADPVQQHFTVCPTLTQLFCVFQALLNIFSLYKGIRKPYTPCFSKYSFFFFLLLMHSKASPAETIPFCFTTRKRKGNELALGAGAIIQRRNWQKLETSGHSPASKPAAAGSKYFSGEYLLLENPCCINGKLVSRHMWTHIPAEEW